MWAGKNFLSLPDRAGKTQNLMLDTAVEKNSLPAALFCPYDFAVIVN